MDGSQLVAPPVAGNDPSSRTARAKRAASGVVTSQAKRSGYRALGRCRVPRGQLSALRVCEIPDALRGGGASGLGGRVSSSAMGRIVTAPYSGVKRNVWKNRRICRKPTAFLGEA